MKAIFHWHGHGHLMKTILQLRFSLPRYSRLNQEDIKTNTWGRIHSICLSLLAFTSCSLNMSMLNQMTEWIFKTKQYSIMWTYHMIFIQRLSLTTPTSSIQFHDTLHSPGNKGHVWWPILRPTCPYSFLRVSLVEFWATSMSPFKFSISRIFLVQWLHFLVGNSLFFMYTWPYFAKSCSFNAFHYPGNYSQHCLYSTPGISSPLLFYASDFVVSPSHQCFQ